jgi:hypothetical protein
VIESTTRVPAAGRANRRAGGLLLALVLLAGGGAACGKKGPPLAPLVRLPGPVQGFSARRLGDTVLVQFAIPAKNQDGATPADVVAVEVYGFTGTPPANDEIVKFGTLVTRVPVRRPVSPEEREKNKAPAPGAPAKGPEAPPAPVVAEPGYDQGAIVTVSETLTPARLQPVVVKPRGDEPAPEVPPAPPVFLPTARPEDAATRTYVAVGVSRKGRRGVFSPRIAVPVVTAPLPPGAPTFTYNETTLTIAWPPPADVPVAPVPPAAPPAPADGPALPPSRSLVPHAGAAPAYDLYLPPKTDDAAKSTGSAWAPIPVPVNPTPLMAPTFTIPVDLGVERCFAVRAVKTIGRMALASPLSPIGCVTPRDTFPPLAPKGLSAVASAGELSLAWEPTAESDLAGYLVLRGEAARGPLQSLTKAPVPETNYVDKTAKPGVRYVYAVVAVDEAGNLSAQSNRIEETAR